jgi:DNA-binding transcriptional LysR family regulator
MEIAQLKYFYTAAKYEHITKAAEELHVAQPALTQSIHRLEAELGVELFVRIGRRIELSKSGKYLMERIGPVLTTLDSLKDDLNELNNSEANIIRLNVKEASAIVAHAITDYQKKHSNNIFKIARSSTDENSDIYVDERKFFTPQPNSESCYFKERIFLAVAKNSKYASMDSVDIANLVNERFAALNTHTKFRKSCDLICAATGFRPQIAFDCEEPAIIMHLVGQGLCVAFYPEYSFSQVKHADISMIPIDSPEFYIELVINRRNRNDENTAVNDFYSFLIDYFNNVTREYQGIRE